MRVSLHETLPAEDTAQRLLFSSADDHVEKISSTGSENVAKRIFPGGSFRSNQAVTERLAYLDEKPHRPGVQEFLRLENAFTPLTPAQKLNLAAAGNDRAVFLVTGQQPGLFGGPILWLYKALTCAAMAKEWSTRLSRPVIPIFWVAGDDADLQECNHLELLDAEAARISGPLSLAFPDAERTIPVGARRIDQDELAALFTRLAPVWNPEIIESLRKHYSAPCTLASGFLHLAQSQLGQEGVLFVDGFSQNLRGLARPTLLRAVSQWESYQASLLRGTAAAEAAGIKTQVAQRPGVVHVFALQNGERHRLLGEAIGTGGNRIYTSENPGRNLQPELANLELTHDVFTRPLVAEALFPVLGHILGPAELRYFAQMSDLFLETTGGMPLLHPRMTAAVAPQVVLADFAAEKLALANVVRLRPSGLQAHLEARIWASHPASEAFAPLTGQSWVESLRNSHGKFFKDAGPLNRFEKSIGFATARYRKTLRKLAYAQSAGDLEALFAHLRWLGDGQGQDRHMNLPTLLQALGPMGLASLRNAIDPRLPDSQVLLFMAEDP